MEILEDHGVVAIDGALKLPGKDQIQISAATRPEGTSRLRSPHLKTTIELGYVVFQQKCIGRLRGRDPGQPQILRQPPCRVPKLRSLRPRACQDLGGAFREYLRDLNFQEPILPADRRLVSPRFSSKEKCCVESRVTISYEVHSIHQTY
jgi:hypothetical protein